MPFTQQMNLNSPTEVTLRSAPGGIRMFRYPVREIESLRQPGRTWKNLKLRVGDDPFAGVAGDLFDVEMDLELIDSPGFRFIVRGEAVRYDPLSERLSCCGASTPLTLANGRLHLRVLIDRTSIEIIANDGRVVLTSCFLPPPANRQLSLRTEGGIVAVRAATVYPLRAAW